MTDVFIFHFGLFFPFYPLKAQNVKILKKYHHFIYVYQNYNQMMYGSWDMMRDRCNYFSFWAIFCPFISLSAQKIKIYKKAKKTRLEISFYIYVPKIIIRRCMVPDIWRVTDVIFISHFGLFFTLLPHKSPKYPNFEKMVKNTWRYYHFTLSVPQIMIRWSTVPQIWCATDVIIFNFGPFLPFYLLNSPKNQN